YAGALALGIPRACLHVVEGDEYAFANVNGTYELHGRGTARVTRDGTVWRRLPTPDHVGNASERCNASCHGQRPPMPDARDPKELIALMLNYPDGEPPWGWYEIGKVNGAVTAYPNVPIFPHGLGSAKPDAPTKWGIVPTPTSTDGS
ncbi:hypothetical protein EBS80_03425, partial [bacterium]|nr:hypothetical protein [bacterium]